MTGSLNSTESLNPELFFEEVIANRAIPPESLRPQMLIELLDNGGLSRPNRPQLIPFLRMFSTHPQATYQNEWEGKWADPQITERYHQVGPTIFAMTNLPKGMNHYYALASAYIHDRDKAYRIAHYAKRIGTIAGWPDITSRSVHVNLHPFMKLMAHHADELLAWTTKPNPVTAEWCGRETSLGHQVTIRDRALNFVATRLSEKITQSGLNNSSNSLPLPPTETLFPRGNYSRDIELFERIFVRMNLKDRREVGQFFGLSSDLSNDEYAQIVKHIETYQLIFLGLLDDIPTPVPWSKFQELQAQITGGQRPNDIPGQLEEYLESHGAPVGLIGPQFFVSYLFDNRFDNRRTLEQYERQGLGMDGWRYGSQNNLSLAIKNVRRSLPISLKAPGLGGASALLTLLAKAEQRVSNVPGEESRLIARASDLRLLMSSAVNDVSSSTVSAREYSIKSERSLTFNGLIEPDSAKIHQFLAEARGKLPPLEIDGDASRGLTVLDKVQFSWVKNKSDADETQFAVSVEAQRFHDLFISNNGDNETLQKLLSLPVQIDNEQAAFIKHRLHLVELIVLALVKGIDVAPTSPLPFVDILGKSGNEKLGTGSYSNFLESVGGKNTASALSSLLESLVQVEGNTKLSAIEENGSSAKEVLMQIVNQLSEEPRFNTLGIAEKIYQMYVKHGKVIRGRESVERENSLATFSDLHSLMHLCVLLVDNPTVSSSLGLMKLLPKI